MFSISSSDVEIIIERAAGRGSVKILNYKLEPFSANKYGLLGEHWLLTIKIEDKQCEDASNLGKVYKFFVKLLGDINTLPKHLDIDVFEEEINFYNEVQPLMLDGYNGEKWSPKCYLAKNGILVLEDLREQGFTARSEQTMDQKSLNSAVATLARFHACSVMTEAKIGKPLNEEFPTFFSEKICNNNNKFGKLVYLGYETMVLMAKKLDLDASLVLPGVYNYVSEMVKPKKQEVNVVCHSDLYKNNIMFDMNNSVVILDYQLLRYASPLIDFSILLHLNTTPEFRKKSDVNLLKHYYQEFRDTLEQNRLKINISSYEDIVEKYHKYKIVGMATAVDYLACLYMDPDVRSEVWNDPEKLERFLLHNRMDIFEPLLERDIDYAKKMKDILSEFLNEAKRVLGA